MSSARFLVVELVVGLVALCPEWSAGSQVALLVLGLSESESVQHLWVHLAVISGGAEDSVDDSDDWDVLLELADLGGLAGDEHLAFLRLNLELLEGVLQLAHLGGQV